MMNAKRGYYSVVQYVPNLDRAESVNIGVLLFVAETSFCEVRMSRDNGRARHVFGVSGDELKQLKDFKLSFAHRIEAEKLTLTTVELLEKFVHTRGNQIKLTEPRFIKVTETCRDQLDRLFEELVGFESKSERINLGAKLKQRFEKAGITDRLKTDVLLRVPVLEREIRVPYGYQNGKFHLLQPVRFKAASVDSNVNLACVYSLEGQSLHNYLDSELGELKLNVIGSFRGESREAISDVRRVLASNDVRLWTENDLPNLIDEIRRTGKKVS
jgi:hypothetical protein